MLFGFVSKTITNISLNPHHNMIGSAVTGNFSELALFFPGAPGLTLWQCVHFEIVTQTLRTKKGGSAEFVTGNMAVCGFLPLVSVRV